MFHSAATFRKTPVALSPTAPVESNGEISVPIRARPPGQYGIVAFQDHNGAEILDLGPLGVPAEPYAFSRQPKLRFGPPEFAEMAFQLGAESLTLMLTLR